ncbi:hypothetical protein QTP86_002009 [Hemibagrus guttatus]|nr:hypothetical protein QTP86_002009 [Hemibagrus guttatus]
MCFVDLEKAFDRVPRGILWEVLWEYGVRGPLLGAVWSLYNRSRSLVRIASYDVVLLAPSSLDLQHALGRFAAECEAAGMRVITSKSEAMVLDWKKVACTLQVGGEVLPQVEQFKYLGVLFTSEGRMDREIDRRIGAAAAVMRSMYRCVVVKKELSRNAKLSIYQSIYVPTLTYGHELWVMTERVRSRIQAAEMSFLRRVAGRSLRDRVRSSVTREELGVEPLLLHIERGQLRWLGHLFRMPPGRLPGEVFRACPTGKRPRGRPRTRWRDYVSRLAWERLGVPPEELEEVSGERELKTREASEEDPECYIARESSHNASLSAGPHVSRNHSPYSDSPPGLPDTSAVCLRPRRFLRGHENQSPELLFKGLTAAAAAAAAATNAAIAEAMKVKKIKLEVMSSYHANSTQHGADSENGDLSSSVAKKDHSKNKLQTDYIGMLYEKLKNLTNLEV